MNVLLLVGGPNSCLNTSLVSFMTNGLWATQQQKHPESYGRNMGVDTKKVGVCSTVGTTSIP